MPVLVASQVGLFFLLLLCNSALAQQSPWSKRMADSFMHWHRDSIVIGSNKASRWD